ncbi:MAG TPA: hypothetical protein VE959_30525 [Bryobacteraceae bacterium]|nr:hypothetical protein [Bryobacteraceae bacterium]
MTTVNAAATGSTAVGGAGGLGGIGPQFGSPGSANSTSVFNYSGTVNGSGTSGPSSILNGPALTVTSSANPNLAGQPLTITAAVTQAGNPVTSGSVTFTENGSAVAGASPSGAVSLNSQGQAAITVTTGAGPNTLHEGDHTIQAAFNTNEESGTILQRVDNPSTASGANPVTFCNPGAVTIPAGSGGSNNIGPAFPNPSNIFVSGLSVPISSITLTLGGFHHPSPVNLLSLLVGPGAANSNTLDFFSATGGTTATGKFDLTVEDGSWAYVPLGNGQPGSGGPWKPTSYSSNDAFTASGFYTLPGGPYNYAGTSGSSTFTSVYGATSANGLWSLYFNQNTHADGGGLDGGWCLTFALVPTDLSISNTHNPANFRQGDTGDTYTITVHNNGPGSTSGTVTVSDTLPAGLTATAMTGAGWNCTSNSFPATGSATLVCTSTAAIASGSDFPSITLTVNVAATATSPATNTAAVSGSGDNTPNNDTATDSTTVTQAADLTVTKTHSGSFKQGEAGDTYSITVTNLAGHAPTAGAVTVVDNPPAGLTITGMGGTNWTTCDVPSHTCSRSDALSPGSSYEPITVTVTVGTGLATSVINQAVVSGGGELNAANDTANDTTTIVAPLNIAASFGAAAISLNGTTSLGYTITDPVGNASMTGVGFTDNLPSGLVVATPAVVTGSCGGGSITANAGATFIGLSGAAIAAGSSCTFSVNVTGTATGVKNNSVTITSNEGGTGNTSSASLTVASPPAMVKAFGSASFAAGAATSLTFTITNPNTAFALTGVGFTDNLPSGLLVATPNAVTGACGGGTITAAPGGGAVSLSGGILAANGTCAFSVNVTGTSIGQKNNTTGNVTSTESGAGGTASASVTITPGPAAHFTVAAPSSATIGMSFNFTVTALDQFNNTATGYTGAVHFTSSDPSVVVPANATLTNGTGTFAATLSAALSNTGRGSSPGFTITAADAGNASITGTSALIVLSFQAGIHLVVSAPATATAGTPINVTVTVKDSGNNTVTGYAGAVHPTSSDAAAILPANPTLTNGVGTFQTTLATAGSQTITATDTVTGSIAGTSAAIAVTAGPATHLKVTAPTSATPGAAFNFTVTALDQFNNTATGYAGAVHFTSSDAAATLPPNSTLTNGAGSFPATLATVGGQTITATDTVTGAITGASGAIAVATVPVTHLQVTAPSSATAGIAFNFTVTALGASNNPAAGYTGPVHFTSSDGAAVLPANATLSNGAGSFSATLNTPTTNSNRGVTPGFTITATDAGNGSITGTSAGIIVALQAGVHLVVSAPATATAGTPVNVTVTVKDSSNNTVSGYTGTVHFTSSDTAATLPSNATLTNGAGTFPATLVTVGSQTITATDTVTGSIAGTSAAIAVAAGPATRLRVIAPASASPGVAFTFTVTALDQFNNTATGYAGAVHFTSSDGAATLPSNSTLTNGAGSFPATLATVGSQSISATDTVASSITGTSNPILVAMLPATHFAIAAPAVVTSGIAFSFTVTALDANNNTVAGYTGPVHFTSSDGSAILPANAALTSGAGTFQATLAAISAAPAARGGYAFSTIWVTDVASASLSGTSNPITVIVAP